MTPAAPRFHHLGVEAGQVPEYRQLLGPDATYVNLHRLSEIKVGDNVEFSIDPMFGLLKGDAGWGSTLFRALRLADFQPILDAIARTYRSAIYLIINCHKHEYADPRWSRVTKLPPLIAPAIVGAEALAATYAAKDQDNTRSTALAELAHAMRAHYDTIRDRLIIEVVESPNAAESQDGGNAVVPIADGRSHGST